MTTRTDALHEAFDRLADHGYAYVDGPGFACHGPMGAEALSALGHDDLVPEWIEAYTARHAPIAAPSTTEPIDPDDERSWRPALGDFTRVSDWAEMFRAALWDEPWQAVVARWVPRLLPGYGGGLTHGLLRVAHAVRSMPADHAPSNLHLDELSKGLAAWAAWFKVLPGPSLLGSSSLGSSRLGGALGPDQAIARLPRPATPWSPLEAGTFARLDEVPDYPAAVAALRPPDDVDAALSDLTAAFCRTMLAHPDGVTQGLVHAVTPIAASRALLPYLRGPAIDALYTRLWQVGAAIVVGFTPPAGRGRPPCGGFPAGVPLRPDEIVARAIEHRDPHVIKFTEACAREHRRRPDPVYLHAASEVLRRTPAW
jgi:hypothetical protein